MAWERSKRAELQRSLDGLAQVHQYRFDVDVDHPLIGWWATPDSKPARGCGCAICAAAGDSRDLHLGYNIRLALFTAQGALQEHATHQRAA